MRVAENNRPQIIQVAGHNQDGLGPHQINQQQQNSPQNQPPLPVHDLHQEQNNGNLLRK